MIIKLWFCRYCVFVEDTWIKLDPDLSLIYFMRHKLCLMSVLPLKLVCLSPFRKPSEVNFQKCTDVRPCPWTCPPISIMGKQFANTYLSFRVGKTQFCSKLNWPWFLSWILEFKNSRQIKLVHLRLLNWVNGSAGTARTSEWKWRRLIGRFIECAHSVV